MTEGLAGESDATPEAIAAYYDAWATADYDQDVSSWGYEAPEVVAAQVAALVGDGDEVLDAGCGTGRAGSALRAAGVRHIVGGDFTPASVAAARELGVYTSVNHLDLNTRLDFDDDRFAATVSVGVFSYVADTLASITELLRVTRPGGVVVFTQRTDLWVERHCADLIESLVSSGSCTAVMSDPSPYLPGHPEFAAAIEIIYTTLTVT